eukprot:SAG25_NODE_135_length_14397_cov_89.177857_8_plen_398_part_00
MWGAALHDCATDVHRPGYASALAFASTEGSSAAVQVLLTLDACVMGSRETEEVIAAVMAALDLQERHQIVFTLSHTHASTGVLSRSKEVQQLPGGDLVPGYLDQVVVACVQAATTARDAMEPAWMTTATGSCKLATHRDTWDAHGTATAPPGAGISTQHSVPASQGQWVCGYGADSVQGPADDTLMVVRVAGRSLGQRPGAEPDFSGNTIGTGVDTAPPSHTIATLYNYGCHPTTLGPGNMHISPDFIGSSREIVEATYGGTAIFLQGASGDIGPMISYSADPASADRNGRMLGYAVCSAVESLLPPGTGLRYNGAIVSGATLAGWSEAPVKIAGAVGEVRSEVLAIGAQRAGSDPPTRTRLSFVTGLLLCATPVRGAKLRRRPTDRPAQTSPWPRK